MSGHGPHLPLASALVGLLTAGGGWLVGLPDGAKRAAGLIAYTAVICSATLAASGFWTLPDRMHQVEIQVRALRASDAAQERTLAAFGDDLRGFMCEEAGVRPADCEVWHRWGRPRTASGRPETDLPAVPGARP